MDGRWDRVTAVWSADASRLAKAVAAMLAEKELQRVGQTAAVTVRGVSATLAYRIDHGEHVRRREAGLSALTRLDWLHTLLGLPAGIPVSLDELPACDQQIIMELPAGCVHVTGRAVVRQIVRPVRVDLAVVGAEGADWPTGLRRAGAFSGYCTRLLALTGVPVNLAEARTAAARYGIGLAVEATSGPVTVVPAERFTPAAHTAAGWRFTEQVYQEIVGDLL
jgi:hypothetical protein